jgi:tetratricopeptide (TPR) repeat protein
MEEKGRADNYFNQGMDFFDQGKFEKASAEFGKCLEVDSLYLDAYYDKAYSDLKLGNKGSACGIWRKLSDMDQKPAEELYLRNCQ